MNYPIFRDCGRFLGHKVFERRGDAKSAEVLAIVDSPFGTQDVLWVFDLLHNITA